MTSHVFPAGYLERLPQESSINSDRIRLIGPTFRVGRAPNNDLVADIPEMSRYHALLVHERGTWAMMDLSTNGISVNSVTIPRHRFVELRDGDIVYFCAAAGMKFKFLSSEPGDGTTELFQPNQHFDIEGNHVRAVCSDVSNTSSVSSVTGGSNTGTPLPRVRVTVDVPVNVEEDNDENEDPHDEKQVKTGRDSLVLARKRLMTNAQRRTELEKIVQNILKANRELAQQVNQLEDKLTVSEQSNKVVQDDLKAAINNFNQLQTETFEKIVQNFTCAICNQIFIDARAATCGHTFCSMCMTESLKIQSRCPVCKKAASAGSKCDGINHFIQQMLPLIPLEARAAREREVRERMEEIKRLRLRQASAARQLMSHSKYSVRSTANSSSVRGETGSSSVTPVGLSQRPQIRVTRPNHLISAINFS